jgi:hypothetical protein
MGCPRSHFWDENVRSIHIEPTSNQSATLDDVLLRETKTTRLVFRPEMVENPNSNGDNLRGTFLYERKGPHEEWLPTETIQLSHLKKGEGVRLELHAGEVSLLKAHLDDLVAGLTGQSVPGLPSEVLVVRGSQMEESLSFTGSLQTLLQTNSEHTQELLQIFLTWIGSGENSTEVINALSSVDPADLTSLQTAAKVSQLKSAIATLEAQLESTDEDYWHHILVENSFIFEYLFYWPVTVVKDKGYV